MQCQLVGSQSCILSYTGGVPVREDTLLEHSVRASSQAQTVDLPHGKHAL